MDTRYYIKALPRKEFVYQDWILEKIANINLNDLFDWIDPFNNDPEEVF